ncbi:MAG TPA: zf-HC2 domain-containing protein [Longimicrobium sp.]|jgi:hypothetical protein
MNIAAEHPDEAKLLGLMDGALDAGERAWAEAHVRECASCRADLDGLRRRLGRLDALLARTDFPPPAARGAKVVPLRRRTPPAARAWLRAAAVLLVVLGAAALATPARAWMAEWLLGYGGSPGQRANPAPAAQGAAPALDSRQSSQVRFAATGPSFTLWIESPQRAGSLLVRTTPSGAATAEVVAGTGNAELLVVPQGLRIRNVPGSAAEYRVVIPASVRTVRVRLGQAPALLLRTAEIGAQGTTVRLGQRQ